ncbi:MAG: hypothetical protein IKF54_01065 [Eubacterium sp.]|nr:hypothetical protein [Eubacterium sp.]
MKHFFIINPVAGQGKATQLEEKIWEQAGLRGLLATVDQKRGVNSPENVDIVIYRTKNPGDAERYVRYICRSAVEDGECYRFYSCGGDGTLNEVVNGCYGFGFAQVACIPFGTGNDYIRCFPEAGDFSDVSAQMDGEPVFTDLIRYNVEGNDPRYCINMFNIGLDCNVADMTSRMKKVPMIKGHFAYMLSLVTAFIQKKGADLKIECDDGFVYDDKLLLVAISNGEYCGGGVKGTPQAVIDDGLMDVSIVKKATRRDFLKLFKKYKNGEHLDDEEAMEHFIIRKCAQVTVTPKGGSMKLCTDGEISQAGRTTFEIVPRAAIFSVPAAK